MKDPLLLYRRTRHYQYQMSNNTQVPCLGCQCYQHKVTFVLLRLKLFHQYQLLFLFEAARISIRQHILSIHNFLKLKTG